MTLQEQADFYRENGYLFAPGILDATFLAELRRESDGALARLERSRVGTNYLWRGGWISEEEREKQRLDAIHDLQRHSAAFTRLLFHPPLLELFRALIGPNVQLHHSKLLAKPPRKGGGFPMHQDYPYFPHDRHTMMAVSIYLDDADEENGCIRVVPGTHKRGPIECDPGGFYLPPADFPVDDGLPCPARAGDALFFNYLTVHGSAPNLSARPRRNVLLQVRDPEDLPTKDMHVSHAQGMMLCGVNPLPTGVRTEKSAEVPAAS